VEHDSEAEAVIERESPGSGVKLVLALVILLVLTALTFGLHFITSGRLGLVVALAIAAAKVAVVGLVFMELRGSSVATRAVVAIAIGFVVLLCLGIFADVGFR
jgi:caa(3)-type oxidase subunit IV